MNTQKPDMPPETPPEILARGPRSLTQETANLTGNSTVLTDGGGVSNLVSVQADTQARAASRSAAAAAEEFSGPAPLMGMTPEQILAVKNKEYAGAPKMTAIGDRTQAFVNWIWNTHPNDAKVRYAYRDIWPDVFVAPKQRPPQLVGKPMNIEPGSAVIEEAKARNVARMAKARAARKPKVSTATPATV